MFEYMENSEIWKPVPGWEGLYEASNLGRIRSLGRWVSFGKQQRYIKPTILKPAKTNGRYYHVNLRKEGMQFPYLVHRLIALTFISNPDNLPEVNHLDENIWNNAVSNLQWCDRLTNVRWGTAIERQRKAKINHPNCSKHIFVIKNGIKKEYPSIAEVARQFGYSAGYLNNILNGRRNNNTGLIMGYL